MKNNFSAPMPYTIDDINKLLDIDNQIKKSKITSLYFSLPYTCELFTGFEQSRNYAFNLHDWNYWKNLIKFVINKGYDVIYLLNSPKLIQLSIENADNKIKKLENLLDELYKIGVKKLRVASPQLLSFLGKNHPEFELFVSTSLDYKTISEYQNFIMFHPEIKQIVPSHDVNKNFKLLKNLKEDYPNLSIELMVNEGCMQGCPHRMIHQMHKAGKNSQIENVYFNPNIYCSTLCGRVIEKYPFHSLTINNNIFPWEIDEYKKLGIRNFKFVGRDLYIKGLYNNEYLLYLKGIDDYSLIQDISIDTFIHHVMGTPELKKLSVKEIKQYLPKISHFKKYGHLCSSRCGVECRYCYKCAEKIQKVFEKKQKQEKKRTIPICVINNK